MADPENLTLEEQIKNEIIKQYGSVLAFSTEIGFNNSTVDSMLTRGLYNAGVGRVLQIFSKLGIDAESLSVGRLIYANDTKKETPPTPAEPKQEEELSKSSFEIVLKTLGIVDVGQDLSEADAKFLADLLNLVRTWLQEKGKHH